MRAVKDNRLDICQLIVEHAQDKNPKDRFGYTTLHEAARNGHLDICRLIMDHVERRTQRMMMGTLPCMMLQREVT